MFTFIYPKIRPRNYRGPRSPAPRHLPRELKTRVPVNARPRPAQRRCPRRPGSRGGPCPRWSSGGAEERQHSDAESTALQEARHRERRTSATGRSGQARRALASVGVRLAEGRGPGSEGSWAWGGLPGERKRPRSDCGEGGTAPGTGEEPLSCTLHRQALNDVEILSQHGSRPKAKPVPTALRRGGR